MNDFASKYQKMNGGGSPRQQVKEGRKAVTKALHEAFKMAISGQVAGINHEGKQYLLVEKTIFEGIIQSGGKMLLSDEQKAFHAEYQILMNMMQSLNIEDEKEAALFDEIDQFSFDFSQYMNDPKGAKKRREVLKEFKETIESDPLLISLEKNLREQLFPAEKEVENNGKLT